jgi:putative oxidoreductase
VLGVVALSLAFTGPGALSVDHAAGFAAHGVGWGLAAAAVAALGAIAQLAQREPTPATRLVDTATTTGAGAH